MHYQSVQKINTTSVQQNLKNQSLPFMSCEVVFGSPTTNCIGVGVCRITAMRGEVTLKKTSRNCQTTQAIISGNYSGEYISMIVLKANLCIKLYRTQFLGNQFKVAQNFEIPNEIRNKLQLKQKNIKPGIYQIEDLGWFYRIDFKQNQY